MLKKKKKGLLLLSKPVDTRVSQDIVVDDTEDEKTLVTCEVIDGDFTDYKKGENVIVGKYSLFPLNYKDEKVYFADEEDVLGVLEKNV